MAVSPAGSVVVPAPRSWPRSWSEWEPLLERQHDRLEALLAALIEQHRQSLAAELLEAIELGEHWLAAAVALCSGHRANHQDAARQALADYCRGSGSRRARLAWLQQLQAWFVAHRQGADAMAYGLARRVSGA